MKLHLIIGNKNFSSWSLRAWLALRHAGLPFEETLIPLREHANSAKEVKDLSPSGRVPTLLADETPIWDSLAIGEFLNEVCPERQFLPQDRFKRAQARSYIAEMHSGFMNLRREMPMNLKATHQSYTHSEAVDTDIARIIEVWTDCLSHSEGPYLYGAYSLVDMAFAPVVTRFKTYDIPVSPQIQAYMDLILDRDDMKDWAKSAAEEPWTFGL